MKDLEWLAVILILIGVLIGLLLGVAAEKHHQKLVSVEEGRAHWVINAKTGVKSLKYLCTECKETHEKSE